MLQRYCFCMRKFSKTINIFLQDEIFSALDHNILFLLFRRHNKENYKAINSTIIPLVPSSFALRYISVMVSLYLRYTSVIPPLCLRYAFASLTKVDRVHYGGRSSSLRRMNEERTKEQRRRECYINNKRCDDTRLRLTALRI